uniref:S-locus F-box-like protein c n=1 Tax=Petunia integrifolia subsp. inflata TaxID=212142 RepID=B0F0G4_PETIN|nr:S-locus F-box-like protein c [Petunia integrifolia subsp. inflata]
MTTRRMMNKLPEDVVIYILFRLPVKSLLRFKCTSKAWYTLILSDTFVKLHHNHATATKEEFILFIRTFREEPDLWKNVASFIYCDDNNDHNNLFPDLDLSHLTSSYCSIFGQLIGPCHGLIALSDSIIIIILNPSTRKYVVLPPSPFGCPKGYHRSIEGIGFGFDSIVNDYKVVRLSDVYWDPPTDYPGPREPKVDIYDLSIDSWRELSEVEFPSIYYLPCSEMYYKEAVHWFSHIDMDVMILCFDIITEIFRTMKIPGDCTFLEIPRYGLAILNECLTLISYPDPMCSDEPIEELIYIWIMKEYGESESWIKKYTIKPLPIESPLAIWKDHLLLLQSISGIILFSWDLNSNEVKEFELHGHLECMRAVIYKESLTTIPRVGEHSPQVQQF